MKHLFLWRWTIAILVLAGIGWQVMRNAPLDWAALHAPSIALLILAGAVGTSAYVALAIAWARLRGQGESWLDTGGVWYASLLARYAPGGVWQGVARIAAGHAVGERASHTLARFAIEQLLGCFSAAVLALLLFSAHPRLGAPLVAGLAIVALVATGAPFLLRRLLTQPPRTLGAIECTMLAHLLMATGFVVFAAAWVPLGAEDVFPTARGFIIAGLAGVLAIFVPAGLGVREGVLAWLLAPRFGTAAAVAISLAARVWLLTCEFVAWGLWAVLARRIRGEPR